MNAKEIHVSPMLLELPILAKVVALSESAIQGLVRKGEFPQPKKLSDRRVAWDVDEVRQWVKSRPVSDILPPPNTGVGRPRKEAA